LVAGLSACTASRPPTPEDLTEELVSAVGPQRFIEGRVPGGFHFGPPASRYRSSSRAPVDSPAILAVLAKAEDLPSRHTPRGLLLRGVARLLAGRIDQSISLLSLSAAARPSPEAWTALSAAYLEAAVADPPSAIELSMRGLDAAEQAIALDETASEAWFNRALAATRLPPCLPGPRAWDEYVSRERDEEWQSEGTRRRAELTAACPAIERLGEVPGHARDRVEHQLLPGWAFAWTQGRRDEAARTLAEAARVSGQVVDATGDPFAAHLVRAVADADADARDRLAGAWMQYASSRELFEQSNDAHAAAAVGTARRARLDPGSAMALLIEVHYATMALQQRQFDVALTSVRQVIDRARARRYQGLVARAQIVRAIVRARQGRLSEAAREASEAGETLERLQDPDLAAAAYGALATAMRALNDPRGSWSALAHTLRVVDRVTSVRRRYVVLYNASLVAQGSGAPRAALRYQTLAVDVAERRGVPATIVEAYTRRAELRERLDPGSGAADLAVARQLSLEVDDPERRPYYSALIDSIEADSLLEPAPAAARERFGRALDFFLSYDTTVVPRLHLGRGRASRRAGDDEGARDDFLAGITAFEAGRLRVSVDNRAAYFDAARELFDEMVSLSDPRTAFAFSERGRALTVVEALGGPVETDLARVASRLPPATALIQYATLPDKVMIWALRREGTGSAVAAESRAALERRVLSFLAAIADEQGTTDVTAQGEALYRLLLQPVQHLIAGADHIIVVADGPIHQLPFALLRGDGRYLVERFGIVNALSASAFLAAERHRRESSGATAVLAVGNPSYDRTLFDHLRPLPSAEREASKIASMYPRHTVLTRGDATRGRFVEAALASGVIHFGGHAVIDGEAPERSALLLAIGDAAGSTLTAPEIARLRFAHAPIIVLAACSTATGATYRMEGATSLSRAFLLAGASSVVGSLWDIDDEVSEAFFVRFHQRLASGDAPAAALRGAQVDLLHAAEARLRAPRAWAAFQLMGALSRPSA
jgi:CHAT domain-containing protein/tetratricopeptide (TPR) repeat protein